MPARVWEFESPCAYVYLTSQIVTKEEFPDGILCIECRCEIFPGQLVFMRPEGMVNDIPAEELVCLFCATLAHLV